ncbi:MAG TPA: hypothetical protein VGM06_05585 [Polyangiaceae bacterium]
MACLPEPQLLEDGIDSATGAARDGQPGQPLCDAPCVGVSLVGDLGDERRRDERRDGADRRRSGNARRRMPHASSVTPAKNRDKGLISLVMSMVIAAPFFFVDARSFEAPIFCGCHRRRPFPASMGTTFVAVVRSASTMRSRMMTTAAHCSASIAASSFTRSSSTASGLAFGVAGSAEIPRDPSNWTGLDPPASGDAVDWPCFSMETGDASVGFNPCCAHPFRSREYGRS